MPRKKLMSWTGSPAFRWRKMSRGQRYEVYCSDLGLPPEDWTEERSLAAANDWWRKKLESIAAVPLEDPRRKVVDAALRKAEFARAHGLADEAVEWEAHAANVESAHRRDTVPLGPHPGERQLPTRLAAFRQVAGVEAFNELTQLVDGLGDEEINVLFGFEAVWKDRLSRDADVPEDKRPGHWAEKWQQALKDDAAVGGRSRGGAKNRASMLDHFVNFLGQDTLASAVTEDRLDQAAPRLAAGEAGRRRGRGGVQPPTTAMPC